MLYTDFYSWEKERERKKHHMMVGVKERIVKVWIVQRCLSLFYQIRFTSPIPPSLPTGRDLAEVEYSTLNRNLSGFL